MGERDLEEKVVNISHKLILDNRKEASVTGVKDVISFDEKEILLQTADGKLQIRGSGLHVKGLNLVLPDMWILLSICLKIPHEKKNHYLQGCSVKL